MASANDNLLSASTPQLDGSGFSFADTSGNLEVIYYGGPFTSYGAATGDSEATSSYDNTGIFSATVAAVPEPSQYGGLVAALTLLVVGFRRGYFSRRRPALA